MSKLSAACRMGLLSSALFGSLAHAELSVLIVEGLGGEAGYQQEFDADVKAIQHASVTLTSAERIQVLAGEGATLNNINAVFKQLSTTLGKEDRLALYLVGHGSYDGYEYKFNIPGADLSGTQLKKLLDGVKADNQLIVATGSSSGALQDVLKQDSRVILTATRTGNERNATHFGRLFAEALQEPAIDTDKNGRVTAQEAFDLATRKVNDYFTAESRLATEHAQISGAQAGAFSLAQLAGAMQPQVTTANAGLLAERDKLNSQLEELRLKKDQLGDEEYFKQLEPLMLKLAELDAQLSQGGDANAGSAEATP